jgi:hypothetical protein
MRAGPQAIIARPHRSFVRPHRMGARPQAIISCGRGMRARAQAIIVG